MYKIVKPTDRMRNGYNMLTVFVTRDVRLVNFHLEPNSDSQIVLFYFKNYYYLNSNESSQLRKHPYINITSPIMHFKHTTIVNTKVT